MKLLTIIRNAKSADEKELQIYEKSFEIALPELFKSFLESQNPIDVYENVYQKNGETFYMDRFYPFTFNDELSFQSVNNELDDFFERKYVSFGSDPGGWQFVISVQESDFGKVYFCRMDEAIEDALTLLADSFEEFINDLEIPEVKKQSN